jgi:DNA-binding response OmpR family regulator
MKSRLRGKVLVVDDDRITLEVVRERLETAGFEVSTRDGALGTSAAILSERPDVVLLDVDMPGLSGDAIAKLLTARSHGASIVLHSASDLEDLRKMAAKCGAAGVIEKTDNEASFLTQFEGFFRRARA